MKADELFIEKMLHGTDQYLIPVFQRYYEWTSDEWQRLWDDITALLEEDAKAEHFMGPMVAVAHNPTPGSVPQYLMIDGQQRLTTIVLLLCAIRDLAAEHELEKIRGQIQDQFLLDQYKTGMDQYKVIPRQRDRAGVMKLMEGKVDESAGRPLECYNYYVKQIRQAMAEGKALETIFAAVAKRLTLVMITLTDENPFEIFETLNSTGKPLEEADLIRNYVFMKLSFTDQDDFDENLWRPFEDRFSAHGEHKLIPLSDYYRDYLMRDGTYVVKRHTYVDFKKHMDGQDDKNGFEPTELALKLDGYAQLYTKICRPRTYIEDEDIQRELRYIARLSSAGTAYPLVLNLLGRHKDGTLAKAELLECLRALQSFVIRRSIGGESTRAYGRWFPGAISECKDGAVLEGLIGYFKKRVWPADEQFRAELKSFQLYRREFDMTRLMLIALEDCCQHKEPVDVDAGVTEEKLTVEHVMPQGIVDDAKGEAWKAVLGPDWEKVQTNLMHTLGNLTLSGYNRELSNEPYETKREELKNSHLEINKYFAGQDTWDAAAIDARTDHLADQLASIWPVL
ncbi:MAG: DUF262 domain-containing protein [Armatimonadia bacterium]